MSAVTRAEQEGRSTRGQRWYLRSGFLLVLTLSIGKALWDSRSGLEVLDLWTVSRAGAALFGPDRMDVFSDPSIQVGPLTLFLQGLLWKAAAAWGLDLQLLFALAVQPTVVLSCLWLVGRGVPAPLRLRAQAVVAALLLVWEVPWNAYIFGHPTEFLIPILWIVAARLARCGRWGPAGIAIAISTGAKAWGVLGVPLLLLAPLGRDRIRSLSVAVAVTVMLYAPFFLLGDVGTFRYRWIVGAGTGAALVMDPGSAFGWLPRLVQGAFAISVGAAVALAARGRSELLVWAPAAAIIGARLATDPTVFSYYWLAPQALLLIAAGWFIGARANVPAILLVCVTAVTFVAARISTLAVSLLLVCIGTTASLRRDRFDGTWLPPLKLRR